MRIGQLMADSGVRFGTSGARGRVADMTDRVCYAYTSGFMQYLLARGALTRGGDLGLAGDLRPSTPRILTACAQAIADSGCRPRDLGRIPTPALTAYGISHAMPTMMVTGSHIPDDRNGIKFNLPSGEILKEDEEAIRAQEVALPEARFDAAGALRAPAAALTGAPEPAAFDAYVRRYLDFFPRDWLAGQRIGIYEHSSVAREALHAVLTGLGARVEGLGRSEIFVPVDTEAVRDEDVALARTWAAEGRFDALVSTDGDGDRPLVADERGEWLRGDIAGVLCARALGASAVVTPISSNSVVERCGWFSEVVRTRIGSPYVIAAMQRLGARGLAPVVGYEANGGFLSESDIVQGARRLPALPTRDAVIVAVAVIGAARAAGKPVSRLCEDLPLRFTASDRLQDFPSALSARCLAAFRSDDAARERAAAEAAFADAFGPVSWVDHTDGVRIGFASGDIVHLRASGNAPELRVYTEAGTRERAREINRRCLEQLRHWRP